jgi:hypothetical protein
MGKSIRELLELLICFIVNKEIDLVGKDFLPLCSHVLDEAQQKAKGDKYIFNGFCNSIMRMYCENEITTDERNRLNGFIFRHEPEDAHVTYWWIPVVKQPRIEFLRSLINNL